MIAEFVRLTVEFKDGVQNSQRRNGPIMTRDQFIGRLTEILNKANRYEVAKIFCLLEDVDFLIPWPAVRADARQAIFKRTREIRAQHTITI